VIKVTYQFTVYRCDTKWFAPAKKECHARLCNSLISIRVTQEIQALLTHDNHLPLAA
jgi:hypothetical protein